MISTLIVLLSDPDSATVAVILKWKSARSHCEFAFNLLLWFFLQAAWEALLRVVGSVPKEVLPSYMKLVRDAVSTARDKERRKKKVRLLFSIFRLQQVVDVPESWYWTFYHHISSIVNCLYLFNVWSFIPHLQGGPVLIPGFCLPKALQPVLPIFLQVITALNLLEVEIYVIVIFTWGGGLSSIYICVEFVGRKNN